MKSIPKSWVIAAPLVLAAEICGAIGVQGFAPNDSNVIVPSTGVVTSAWKQVGACGNSAVQISPSWVLSAHHSHCSVGSAFRRVQDGVQQSVNVAWSQAFATVDLHLSRLETPMPLKGEFVPLAYGWGERFVGADVSQQTSVFPRADILGVGYGRDSAGVGQLRAGWAPLGNLRNFVDFKAVNRGNPRLGHPIATVGDSGGGLFLFGRDAENGALVGVMQWAGTLPNVARGIPEEVKHQIETILSDPLKNPSGERVAWFSVDQVLGAPEKPVPSSVNYELAGLIANNPVGLFTSAQPGTLKIQMPEGIDFRRTPDEQNVIEQYVVRLVHEKHIGAPSGYSLSTTVNAFVKELNIGSGIMPGKWYGTVHAKVFDRETGFDRDGLTHRVVFDVPENTSRPRVLKTVEIGQWERVDFGGSLPQWCINLTPYAGSGVEPEGVIWTFNTPKGSLREAIPGIVAGGLCTHQLYESGPEAGTIFEVTAQPFRGVAVGPVTNLKLVVPANEP